MSPDLAAIIDLAKSEKLSAGQIGKRLGCSRAAVVGKLHRAGYVLSEFTGATPQHFPAQLRLEPTRADDDRLLLALEAMDGGRALESAARKYRVSLRDLREAREAADAE